jgi:O-antigen/teichoic acid export membrane protein
LGWRRQAHAVLLARRRVRLAGSRAKSDTRVVNEPGGKLRQLARRLAVAGGGAKRLASIGHLLTGNFANAVLMLIGTTIAARSLGPASYGVFALVLTIGRFSERIVRFESWQPLIKYIADEEVSGSPQRQAQLFLYGLLLDVVCALLAAVLTVAAGYLLLGVLDLQSEQLVLIAIYAVAIAANIRGMPTAALRLAGQFRTLAYVQICTSALRIALAGAALAKGAGLIEFVVIWTLAQTLDSLLFLWLGFRALGKLGVPNPLTASWRRMTGNFPGFMGFAWSTNISGTMRTLTQEADTLLVGALAGNAAAGFYHIAKRIAKVAQQVGGQVQAVLYPDMARMWARAEIARFRRLTARIQLSLAAIGLTILAVCWMFGKFALDAVFGTAFVDAYPLLLAQLVAVVLILHSAPSRSALLAMDKHRLVLAVALVSTVLFFAVAWLTIPAAGALGANYAHIAFAALTAIALDIAWWRHSRAALTPNELPA